MRRLALALPFVFAVGAPTAVVAGCRDPGSFAEAPLAASEVIASRDGGEAGAVAEGSEAGGAPHEPMGAPAVQLIGRFDVRDEAGPLCAWPGCRIIARFQGSSVSVRLNEIDESWMEGAPSEWDVAIDGVWQSKLVTVPGEKVYVIKADLPTGEHVIELFKRSEAQNGTTQFLGFDFGAGSLLAPPPRKARRLEIIGDSAAAGFGVEGVGLGPDCPGPDWAAKWQNFRRSLGVRLGEGLDAEVVGTVYSGKGMAKNIWHPDKETMPVIFSRSNPNDPTTSWDFSSYVPHVVVIMIGGNDFAVGQPTDEGPATVEAFTAAYEAFVVTLRDRYPEAHVFLVTSPSVTDAEPAGRSSRTNVMAGIANVISRRNGAGDTRVHAIAPPVADASELTGCNGHGSPEFHRRVANDLTPTIQAKTGW